jgi:SAM-dependent methyltransferase
MEQFSQKFSYAVRHPVVAAIRVGQIAAAIGKDRISAVKAKFQRSELSKDLHHAQYADKQALERHRKLYVEYESTNLFNHPENRIQDLMSKHPQVRSLAVDIGCGGGWVSAHLSRDFASVVGIEPSAAALEIAKSLYPAGQYQNITWINAYAEPGLMATPMPAPTLLVTCCVLSHLPDNVVEGICRAVNTVPPSGSILSFAEVFGPARAREMWHVRPESWWRERLSNWDLDFHGPEAPTSGKGHRKGIHGVRR